MLVLTASLIMKQGGYLPGVVQLVPTKEELLGSVSVTSTPSPELIRLGQEMSALISCVLLAMNAVFSSTSDSVIEE
jgi:hypothetical protein